MRRTLTRGAAIVLVGGTPLAGCLGSSDEISHFHVVDTAGACAPGKQVVCACPGGVLTGVQTCDADGKGYGECMCPPAAINRPPTGSVKSKECVERPAGSSKELPAPFTLCTST